MHSRETIGLAAYLGIAHNPARVDQTARGLFLDPLDWPSDYSPLNHNFPPLDRLRAFEIN